MWPISLYQARRKIDNNILAIGACQFDCRQKIPVAATNYCRVESRSRTFIRAYLQARIKVVEQRISNEPYRETNIGLLFNPLPGTVVPPIAVYEFDLISRT